MDSERTEASALKRENQSLVESCDSLEKARQKIVHDLGVKEQQVSYWYSQSEIKISLPQFVDIQFAVNRELQNKIIIWMIDVHISQEKENT